jgi:hypothetical protein
MNKKAAPSPAPNPQITLAEVREFLYSDHKEFHIDYDAIKFFDADIQVSIALCSGGSIKISKGCGADRNAKQSRRIEISRKNGDNDHSR